jgi:mono/diheme cytochrome c family protein
MRTISFLVMLLLMSFDSIAQEEHHMHEQPHRHPKYAKIKNPVAMTGKSIAVGNKLYEEHCIACHGKAGRGGIGPSLTGSVLIHGNTDGEIFHVITDGIAGTKMKGFEKQLIDEMRWHLVNYIKSIRETEEVK